MRDGRAVALVFLCAALILPTRGFACQTSAECDDGNACTEDLCDTTLGCVYSFVNTTCNDGNACSTSDVCNGGTCVGGAIATGCTSCQAMADLPAGGGTFVGTTSGTGTVSSTCGSTGPSPERTYRWTPDTSGTAVIQTCGSGTLYDSVVHVHTGTCTGTEVACNDDTSGCSTGEPNDHHGSRVLLAVTAGQTYVIAVDGYNGARGTYTLTIIPPSVCGNGLREGVEGCDGSDVAGCPSGECAADCTCVPPAGGLPDLVPAIADVSLDFGATVADGDVVEGCAEATAGVDLLRFGAYSRNLGTADFVLGDPLCPSPCDQHPLEVCGDPDFICSPAQGHNHAHYNNYARYELLDASGQAVVVGHKQGYCLRDTECANPVYTCTDQGITAGCSDLYGSNLGCQYLDITGIPSGTYVLRITIDPFDRIIELSEGNNVAQQVVTITRPGTTATPTRTATRTPTPAATPTGGGATASTTPGGGTPATPAATPTALAGCGITAVIPPAGGTVTGTTTGTSQQAGTCGSTGASPEKLYQWTPAASGLATIRTCGTASLYDTVLYVRGDSCTGPELGCNDDTAGCGTGEPNDHHGSSLLLNVTAGRTYVIAVDGYNGARGAFSLTIVAPAGPTPTRTATPSATTTVTPSTTASPTGSGTTTPTPAESATATESATPTASSSLTPAPTDSATPSATDSATASATDSATPTAPDSTTPTPSDSPTPSASPLLTATPAATATPTPVVPSSTATFVPPSPTVTPVILPATPTSIATVTPLPTPTALAGCGITAVIPPAGGTVTGTTTGTSQQAGTCGSTGASPEKLYQWTPAASGLATIRTCGTASLYDTVLYVRGDSCTGPELGCNDDTAGCGTGEPNDHHGSSLLLNVTAGRTYVIAVDGYNGARGAFSLTIVAPASPTTTATPGPGATATPIPTATRTSTPVPTATPSNAGACAAAVALPSAGGVFGGTTSGTGAFSATCANSVPAPENVYSWVAPRSGTLVIETCGTATNFDTVVTVRGPSCESGPERACNDDTAGCGTGEPNDHHGSRVSTTVTAGTTYFFVVDGYASAQGAYQLRVTPP